jgi:fatty-acyl-CoA synthase
VIVDDKKSITYMELFLESNHLADYFYSTLQIQKGAKVAFLCRNNIQFIQSLFAVSRIGGDMYFLNTEMGREQIKHLLRVGKYDVLIYDIEFSPLVTMCNFSGVKINSNQNFTRDTRTKLPRASNGKMILQTGGTTGKPKEAGHKPSLFNYLDPFLAWIEKLKIREYQTAYIGTPIYHGYGMAVLLLFIPLGKKIVVTSQFEAKRTCHLINKHQIELITVVPVMLDRLLQYNKDKLKSLRCIASGGAKLNTNTIERVFQQFGNVLYNLYGTSEAGLNIIATPKDLMYFPKTLGRKISGVRFNILDEDNQKVKPGTKGYFAVKNSWSMYHWNAKWIKTGDRGYQDKKGYIFLSGRADEMIISGGENVYPSDLEQILALHPKIEEVVVIGIGDLEFGQRLKAFIKAKEVTEQEIVNWLKNRIARYQMPKEVVILSELPYTNLGKLDKKKLTHHEFKSD